MGNIDRDLREIMKLAKLQLPSKNFDETIMEEIEKLDKTKNLISRSRKLGVVFFFLSILLAGGMNFLFSEMSSRIIVSHTLLDGLLLASQLFYVILIVLLAEKIYETFSLFKRSH